jgi:hypothetical protein
MIFLLFGCPSKSPTHTYKNWDPTEITYDISLEYQGMFRANGSVQADIFQNIDVVATCTGEPTDSPKQKLSCNMTVDPIFSGIAKVDIKENQIKNLVLPPNSQDVYDVISTALGSILPPAIPTECELSQSYKVKKPQEHMRIPFLNGPSSHLHNYEVIQCDPHHLSMTGKFTVSAQSTENTSAPRFTFGTTDHVEIHPDGYIKNRTYKQSLITSTTTLAPNSIYQSIKVSRKQ